MQPFDGDAFEKMAERPMRMWVPVKSMNNPADVYQGLRNMALLASRDKVGLASIQTPSTPWGVIMDWGVGGGHTATVAAFADGSASIYLSNGGGFIGGAQSHDSIRHAGRQMVEIAAECQPGAQLVESYPLPECGKVMFYFVTDVGVFSAAASEDDLTVPSHPMSKLHRAAHEIIGRYRSLQ